MKYKTVAGHELLPGKNLNRVFPGDAEGTEIEGDPMIAYGVSE